MSEKINILPEGGFEEAQPEEFILNKKANQRKPERQNESGLSKICCGPSG